MKLFTIVAAMIKLAINPTASNEPNDEDGFWQMTNDDLEPQSQIIWYNGERHEV